MVLKQAGKRGRPRKLSPKPKYVNKNKRNDIDIKHKGENRAKPPPQDPQISLQDREIHGLTAISEENLRTYIAVAYVTRFNSPPKEDWTGIVSTIAKEINVSTKTIRLIFTKLDNNCTVEEAISHASGSGRKKKLPIDNEGLRAGAFALNS